MSPSYVHKGTALFLLRKEAVSNLRYSNISEYAIPAMGFNCLSSLVGSGRSAHIFITATRGSFSEVCYESKRIPRRTMQSLDLFYFRIHGGEEGRILQAYAMRGHNSLAETDSTVSCGHLGMRIDFEPFALQLMFQIVCESEVIERSLHSNRQCSRMSVCAKSAQLLPALPPVHHGNAG